MKVLFRLILAGIALFAILQLIRPGIPAKPAAAEIQAPPAVRQILAKSCYSCHSDERRLSWFDQIVPAYWLVRYDVLTARAHLNFSTVGAKPPAAQKAALYEAANMIQLGVMPPQRFLRVHPEARVTREELEALKAYLNPWPSQSAAPGIAQGVSATPTNANTGAGATNAEISSPVSLSAVQPEFNGFPFDPGFESWKLLSTTDRGDNNTFRFILGNEVAVSAAQSGNISPWPDGTRFAKIAWQQELGPDGLMHPGKFIQVELMAKGAEPYRSTAGWGWGRWRGLNLQPYGTDANFVSECTTCHLPVAGNDFVYTLPITPAKLAREKLSREEVVNNRAAALPANLPYQPLAWNAITMYVDPKARTTATLYGNTAAITAVHPASPAVSEPAYPEGSVLALVTWAQRDDPHWFGGRIPDLPQSVEFVQLGTMAKVATYQRFAGPGLTKDHPNGSEGAQRTNLLLSLRPAQMP
jgi:mono/diheme cytochrome c family protein